MRASSTSRRSVAQSGFSLLETLVVLAVLGVLASAATPALRAARDRSLIARASASLTALLVRARAGAVREGRPFHVAFDPQDRSVSVPESGDRVQLDPAVVLTLTTAIEAAAGPSTAILFLPDGTGTGGRLQLRVSDGAEPLRSIRVSWLTGAVSDER